MIDIVDHIDKAILCCLTGKSWGLCRQLLDDKGEIYPATYEMKQGRYEKVTPYDKYRVQWFHRLNDSSLGDSETYSFGRTLTKINSTQVRTILLSEFALNETPLNSMLDAMVDFMSPVSSNITQLSDYKFVEFGDSINVSRNRTEIWNAEFSNAYRDKYQMRYNIYAIEFTIDYIKCHECAESN
jgi:phage anti-repressor protein